MYKNYLFKIFSSYSTSFVSSGWRTARFYWYSADKGSLIFFSIVGLVIAVSGFLMYSLFANQTERQDLSCLALNVYFEARGEPMVGQYAVAEVTMNRVASSRYPDTVCGVVYQKNWDSVRRRHVGAFSWTESKETPPLKGEEWQRALAAAETVYYRRRPSQLNGALFYHAVYVKPNWSRDKKPVARIGKHVFYR
jgi:spore germination cell wall hydrolase CwlJ-like protein